MQQGQVVELTAPISLSGARISVDHEIPMADSLILATAHAQGATLWTQDADFEGIPGVKYVPKK